MIRSLSYNQGKPLTGSFIMPTQFTIETTTKIKVVILKIIYKTHGQCIACKSCHPDIQQKPVGCFAVGKI